MSTQTESVLRLLKEFAAKLKVKLDYPGFGKMSESIDSDEITQKYLDETYRAIVKKINENKLTTATRRNKLDVIAFALGYEDYNDFENKSTRPVDPQLASCTGLWWSYVWGNSGNDLLKAPVVIFEDKEEGIQVKLKGKENVYRGSVKLRGGCLMCELDSGREKKLYVILKADMSEKPKALQGTFAGLSSTGDPIAGREIFIRAKTNDFSEMKWEAIPADSSKLDEAVRKYFTSAAENRLKIDNHADLNV